MRIPPIAAMFEFISLISNLDKSMPMFIERLGIACFIMFYATDEQIKEIAKIQHDIYWDEVSNEIHH